MNKKDFLVPVLAIGLSLAFVFVSLLVFLSGGKSGFWISKKLKIGALLLSLTAIANQACDRTNCYDPAPVNTFDMDNADYSRVIKVNLKDSNKLTGILYGREGIDFSFNVMDSLNTSIFQTGKVLPVDGSFDSDREDVVIELDENLVTDTYRLNLYDQNTTDKDALASLYYLEIQNEN